MGTKANLIGLLAAALLVTAGCQGKIDNQSPTCAAGQQSCSGQCKTVATDQQNCGACGTACASGETCQAGQCLCSSGLLACNGSCVSPNAAHCGGCSTMCSSGQVCSGSMCQTTCATGEMQCSDGACVATAGGDALHCGGCNACPAGAVCNAGICGCSIAGQMLCGNACVDTMTSAANCGGCNQACNGTCTNGVCNTTSGTAGSTGAAGSTGTGGAGGTSTACTPLPAVPRRLWRLSVEQWQNGVKDLLALSAAPTLTARGGEAAYAFFSDVTLQVDPDLQFAMYQAADATVAALTTAQLNTLAPCSGTTATAQTACAMTFAGSFGQKAFRRPLDSTEVTNVMKVYTQGAMADYATGIRMMIEALLISPSFVYRTELGPSTLTADSTGKYPDTTMTPYEIASQLGFTFLGSVPDAALMAAAADGSLGTTAGLTTQINRLLGLAAVKANLTGIMIDWFNVRQMFDKPKDTSLLTALSAADQDQTGLTNDLYTSTQQLFTNILWNGTGKIDDLLSTQQMVVNKRLATLYPGLTFSGAQPSSNTTFVSASWPSSQTRSGILTLPSYLWAQSDPSLNSIVKRGKAIHDDVLCQDALGSPVDLTTPSAMNVIACKSPDGTTSLSTCDSEILKSDARMMYQPCKSCHTQMDPYSRVLQNFGPVGNYRTADEAGRAIDPSVTFVPNSPLAPQTLSGAPAFAQAVLSSGVFDGCSVQKVASYAIGQMIRTYATCDVQTVRGQTDGTITSLFRQVALASFVRARAGGMK